MRRSLPLAVVVLVLAAGGCTAGKSTARAASNPAPAPSSGAAEPSSSPARPLGYDDLNDDGTPDPACGTQDFGGDLVLKIPCDLSWAHEPEQGTRLVKDSLYRLNGPDFPLDGISGEMLYARSTQNKAVFVLVFNSDQLFATGSAELGSPAEMTSAIAVINSKLSGGTIQVRGHTDATGTAAGNQALSEHRAQNVQAFLTSHGVKAGAVTAIGFGRTRPLVEETNPDGSVSTAGRAFNRRVELAITMPA